MKSTCISHPEREPLVIIRKSQIEFCEGNQCAAAVMSYLEYWHNWKLDSDQYNKKSNEIAEIHGDPRSLNEDVYQFHTLNDISDGIMNLYSTKSISEALKLLELKKVITIHRNPNPRYHYDKTKYFRFYPDVYNSWLKDRPTRCGNISTSKVQKRKTDTEIFPHPSGKNASPCGKIAAPITEINNTDFNHSLTVREDFFEMQKTGTDLSSQSKEEVQSIIDALIERGMPLERFNYSDVIPILERLQTQGATITVFLEGYNIAVRRSQDRGFGIRYLEKIVADLLKIQKTSTSIRFQPSPPTMNNETIKDESNLKNLYWMDEVPNEGN